jgi:hypothetical protein
VTAGVPERVVVLVGTDAAALGAIARDLETGDTRAAVFVGDVTEPDGLAALREFVAELFPSDRP